MFDKSSRYFNLETTTISVPDQDDGTREVRYVRRRIIPPSENLTTLVEHTVAQGERLDNITARYLGDPTQFWRVCDANDVLQPEELEETGGVVKIALPDI
ncbi:MAG: LysM domain-containing protein [Pyrinomonadaceae bacterium]|nr:LysM domain-containing protein [Pyrinomonadaceae bacterium]